MKIVLVAFDEFTDVDLFLPWDLLNRVPAVSDVRDWEVIIVGTKRTHRSATGLEVPMHGTLEEVGSADAVIFASGSRGIYPLLNEEYLTRIRIDSNRQLVGSMCSGALLLGALGMLSLEKATTYPSERVRATLREYGAVIVDEPFVCTSSNRVATAAGCLAAIDLSRWVIASLVGEEVAERVLESVQPVGRKIV